MKTVYNARRVDNDLQFPIIRWGKRDEKLFSKYFLKCFQRNVNRESSVKNIEKERSSALVFKDVSLKWLQNIRNGESWPDPEGHKIF